MSTEWDRISEQNWHHREMDRVQDKARERQTELTFALSECVKAMEGRAEGGVATTTHEHWLMSLNFAREVLKDE